jgi:hypothetical protein
VRRIPGAGPETRSALPPACSNTGACVHLKSIGFFETLRGRGVEIDDRGVLSRDDPKAVLSITHFETPAEAVETTNLVFDRLRSTDFSSPNLSPAVNAAEHSQSEVGSLACVQFLEFGEGPRFSCAVADGGVGIRASLSRNPALVGRVSYDRGSRGHPQARSVFPAALGPGLPGDPRDPRELSPPHTALPGDSGLPLHPGLGAVEE